MKTCIIIAGPTAVGKTAVAIDLAKYFSTEIISADSRQCYKELNIGVAKPSNAELAAVHHYFINSHSITEDISAAAFEQYALKAAAEIFSKHDVAVMVGGTGLYIRAFADGLDDIPAVPASTRQIIAAGYEAGGMSWLRQQLQQHDPEYYSSGELDNPQRMLRALEVKASTGKSIRAFQSQAKKERPFRVLKIGLEMPRESLYERINHRVDQMLDAGLVEEARQLFALRQLNALQTVGYRELFDHFEGNTDVPRAVELIKQNSRHYAKRQMTWFKKDAEVKWVDVAADRGRDVVSRVLEEVKL